ncbi:hypothetical protein QR680_013111 [Steinernema hermaphroditum]|uniref:Uncharacterized protein n=1 Tax=Steinernema hermaphroditum TaxID=289476 RepID=A0AA39M114_9BILA|nr:hypothetical protein QR680_013111 [Steinernema hermaphroditum]
MITDKEDTEKEPEDQKKGSEALEDTSKIALTPEAPTALAAPSDASGNYAAQRRIIAGRASRTVAGKTPRGWIIANNAEGSRHMETRGFCPPVAPRPLPDALERPRVPPCPPCLRSMASGSPESAEAEVDK